MDDDNGDDNGMKIRFVSRKIVGRCNGFPDCKS